MEFTPVRRRRSQDALSTTPNVRPKCDLDGNTPLCIGEGRRKRQNPSTEKEIPSDLKRGSSGSMPPSMNDIKMLAEMPDGETTHPEATITPAAVRADSPSEANHASPNAELTILSNDGPVVFELEGKIFRVKDHDAVQALFGKPQAPPRRSVSDFIRAKKAERELGRGDAQSNRRA
mmetsp:Transcript_143638/g.250442  ORF Transcript_143638/g.250442 Transcript_143638/m.250442 type:complete len:176 (-) Transcript_143638:32-559(-)